jgi:hypothetical protein
MDAGPVGRPDDRQGIGGVLIHDHEPDPHCRSPSAGCPGVALVTIDSVR